MGHGPQPAWPHLGREWLSIIPLLEASQPRGLECEFSPSLSPILAFRHRPRPTLLPPPLHTVAHTVSGPCTQLVTSERAWFSSSTTCWPRDPGQVLPKPQRPKLGRGGDRQYLALGVLTKVERAWGDTAWHPAHSSCSVPAVHFCPLLPQTTVFCPQRQHPGSPEQHVPN